MPTLQVRVRSAQIPDHYARKWNVRSYVSVEMFSKRHAKTPKKGGPAPIWNQVFLLNVSSVARLDLVLNYNPGIGGEKILGATFVDASILEPGREVEFDSPLPRGGAIQFSVCATDFDPQQFVASGYLPLAAPLVFNSRKSYEISMKTRQVIDLDAGRPVFRLQSSRRSFCIKDLCDTPLIQMKCSTKMGSFKYKTQFGGAGGPVLCYLREFSGNPTSKLVMTVPNTPNAIQHVHIEGNWRRGNYSSSRGQFEVASVRKVPGRTMWVTVNPGEDILMHLAYAVAMNKIAKSNKQHEVAFFVCMVVVTLPLLAPVLVL